MVEKLSDNILTGLDGVVTVNGSINQTCIITGPKKQKKYNLTYEAIQLNDTKNHFLIHLTYDDGTVNTYCFPIQFLGLQTVVFEVPFAVGSIQFCAYGNMQIKDIALKALIADPLTDEQKESLNKVGQNSEYWDRILAITNALGNVITEKLEGSINTALNTITGASGKMYWEDGRFICRDGATDATSTMAMMISPGGFMIADKKNDGNWNWRTFGTGKGFSADMINVGKLSAIAIEGVSITGSVITGGTINGVTINGATVYSGDVASGNYVEISPNNPIKVWRGGKIVSSLGYSAIGGGNLTIYDKQGSIAFKVECLEDGDIEIFGNNDNSMMPDPNHEGFFIPNPNTRKMRFKAGTVLFEDTALKIHYNYSGITSEVATVLAVTNVDRRVDSVERSLQSLSRELQTVSRNVFNHSHSEYASNYHTHSEYASSNHSHNGYASSNHSHSEYASNYHNHSGYASSNHSHYGYAPSNHSHNGYASSNHTHNISSGGKDYHTHSCSSPGWSDRRLKENIEYINPKDFMEFANRINLASYNFINDETKREDIGVIAQDLLLHPIGQHFVHESDNGMYYVDYAKLATTALACSKHLYKEIESINARLERLERS